MHSTALLSTTIRQKSYELLDSLPIGLPSKEPANAARGVPRTCYDDVPASHYLGRAGVQERMINKQGLSLNTYYWPARRPKAVLLFVHGHGAHLMFELLKVEVRV